MEQIEIENANNDILKKIKIVKDFTFMGKGQIILKKKLNEKESVYISATEKRCDGHIAVW